MVEIKKALIFINTYKPSAQILAEEITRELAHRGIATAAATAAASGFKNINRAGGLSLSASADGFGTDVNSHNNGIDINRDINKATNIGIGGNNIAKSLDKTTAVGSNNNNVAKNIGKTTDSRPDNNTEIRDNFLEAAGGSDNNNVIKNIDKTTDSRPDNDTDIRDNLLEAAGGGVAFCLGGDGTVLYAARAMAPLGVPILPINLGTFGFIASVPPDEWLLAFNLWLDGKIRISRRLMLEISVEREGKIVFKDLCLNEMVVSADGIAKVIRLHVESEYMRLGKYRSDGLIIATPTGSTAYSVSAGGPILDPEMSALIINPICPFTLSNRPLVVPSREALVVEVEKEQRSAVVLTLDGQITEHLEPCDRIYIKQAPFEVQLIASDRVMFYKALRTKLSWGGGPDA